MNAAIPCYIHDILKLSSRVQVNTKFSVFKLKHPPKSNSANIPTTDQRCFNIVDNHGNNVDLTLKMKQNPTSDFNIAERYTMLVPNVKRSLNIVAQRWYNGFPALHNVVSTLIRHYFNVVSKWPQSQLKRYRN